VSHGQPLHGGLAFFTSPQDAKGNEVKPSGAPATPSQAPSVPPPKGPDSSTPVKAEKPSQVPSS
jgi:hypothetical protein